MSKGFHDSDTPAAAKDSWRTPFEIVAYWENRIGTISLDVAADPYNRVTDKHYTIEDNALEQDWHKDAPTGIAWCNPPYSNITPWVTKATEEAAKGLTTIMLIAGTHETTYVRKALDTAERVFFVTGGRIGYVHPVTFKKKSGGRAPSFVFIFSPHAYSRATVEFIERDTMLEQGANVL